MTRRTRIGAVILVMGALTAGAATAAGVPASGPTAPSAPRAARPTAAPPVAAPPARAAGAPSAAETASVPPTATQQLSWLVSASTRVPIASAELSTHISGPTLRQIGGPSVVNRTLAELGTLTLVQPLETRPQAAEALIRSPRAEYVVTDATDASGLIVRLSFTPYLPGATSWRTLDSRLHALAPQVGFAAAQITAGAGCRVLHGVDPDRPRPLGSAFKLYVLGALGQAITDHHARWNQRLRIRAAWKSLPSGVLQDAPVGTALTLRTFADLMISISDNTAADHLLHSLGRGAVEHQLHRFGNRHAQLDVPFPTTRELFALKGANFPTAAAHYLSLGPAARLAALGNLDRIPLGSITSWTTPRKIDSIEWFASPADICRAYAGLAREDRRPGLAPIGQALSINDDGIGLDRRRYPTVWFKGGSEPGVVTLTYMVHTADHRTLVDVLTLANPKQPISPLAAPQLLALARSGIVLADRYTSTAGRSAPIGESPHILGST